MDGLWLLGGVNQVYYLNMLLYFCVYVLVYTTLVYPFIILLIDNFPIK